MSTGFPAFLLIVTGLVVAFRTWLLVRMLWNLPLAHGPGLFLGVEVASGFYEGPGSQWLKRYRALMLTEYLVEVLALAAVAVWGRWGLLPVCAGAGGGLFTFTFVGFAMWTRAKLRGSVPAATRFAVPLESRSLRDYVSWRAESVAGALMVVSWALLVTQGTLLDRLRPPVVLTYLLLGLFAAKIGVVRMGFTLPPERTEEHHRWFDAHRRFYLRLIDKTGWLLAAFLAGYAILRRWPVARDIPWLFWGMVGLIMGIWVLMTVLFIRSALRLAAMGRDLRPPACRPSAFPRTGWLRDRGLWWTAAYAGGLFLLLAVLPR